MATPANEAGAMMEALGLHRQVQMGDGRAVVEFTAGLHMCHSGAIVHGGFVTAWIDTAMAQAAHSLGPPGITPLSLELKVSFFSPVRPGLVIAEGWVERPGRSICFAEGVLRDADGGVLAKASSTMRLASTARVAERSRAVLGSE